MTTISVDIPAAAKTSGERRLVSAILRRAILDFLGDSPGLISDSESWIFKGPDEREYSFNWICETLGIETEMLRSRLRTLRDSGDRVAKKSHLEGAFL